MSSLVARWSRSSGSSRLCGSCARRPTRIVIRPFADRSDEQKKWRRLEKAVEAAVHARLLGGIDPPSLETLAGWNGYKRIDEETSSLTNRLGLAEGVVALLPDKQPRRARIASLLQDEEIEYLLFAKKKQQQEQTSDSQFPVFVQEDITLYRILEGKADELLVYLRESMSQWFHMSIRKPLQTYLCRRSTKEAIDGNKERQQGHLSKTKIVEQDDSQNDGYNLLLLGRNKSTEDIDTVKLYLSLKKSEFLLVLPHHKLGHKDASTLISVSLVVLGALPLTYRSVSFAIQYPYLWDAMIGTVVGTVAYGLWSSRYHARTSQALVIERALSDRVVVGQVEAATLLLRQNAVNQITRQVLRAYHELRFPKGDDELLVEKVVAGFDGHSHDAGDERIALEIALQIGLIEERETTELVDETKPSFDALPLDAALNNATMRTEMPREKLPRG